MPYGPVPSTVLNLLKEFEAEKSTDFTRELQRYVRLDRNFQNPRFVAVGAPDINALSQSEIEVLDWAAEHFGHMNFDELKTLSHEAEAYRKGWANKGWFRRSGPMDYADFFEEDDPASVRGALDQVRENAQIKKVTRPVKI
jgi:hypothetical protein